MHLYRYEIPLKTGQTARADQSCHWMLDVDQSGLEKLVRVFENEAPYKKKGIITAYEELTIPKTQVGKLQIPNNNDRWAKYTKTFVDDGVADFFATAVLEGRMKNYPDVNLIIWHPNYPVIFLHHEACDNANTRKCNGDIHLHNNYSTFSLQQESWYGRTKTFEKIIENPENEDERRFALSTLKDYKEKHKIHTSHVEDLFNSVNQISKYLPQLKKGTLYRQFALLDGENKKILRTQNVLPAEKIEDIPWIT